MINFMSACNGSFHRRVSVILSGGGGVPSVHTRGVPSLAGGLQGVPSLVGSGREGGSVKGEVPSLAGSTVRGCRVMKFHQYNLLATCAWTLADACLDARHSCHRPPVQFLSHSVFIGQNFAK